MREFTIEFIRNRKTGVLEVWKNGKKIGEVVTMGDVILQKDRK
jgi:hypothetical protein